MAVADNDERPFVITIGSPKGGCGKTMTTILLAGEFAAGGYKVLMIDTDPQRSAVNCFETSKKAGYELKNIGVQAITELGDLAKKLEKPGDFQLVLVDIQGTAAAAVGSAVAFADFVVIPTRGRICMMSMERSAWSIRSSLRAVVTARFRSASCSMP